MKTATAWGAAATLALCSWSGLAQEAQASLYERMGGRAPLAAIANDFFDIILPDPVMNKNPEVAHMSRRAPVEFMKAQLTMVLCQDAGGPCKHRGRPMDEAHARLKFREDDWQRSLTVFKQVLAKHKIPTQESSELVAIFSSMKSDLMGDEKAGHPGGHPHARP